MGVPNLRPQNASFWSPHFGRKEAQFDGKVFGELNKKAGGNNKKQENKKQEKKQQPKNKSQKRKKSPKNLKTPPTMPWPPKKPKTHGLVCQVTTISMPGKGATPTTTPFQPLWTTSGTNTTKRTTLSGSASTSMVMKSVCLSWLPT